MGFCDPGLQTPLGLEDIYPEEPAFQAKVRDKGQNDNRKEYVASDWTNNQEVHLNLFLGT